MFKYLVHICPVRNLAKGVCFRLAAEIEESGYFFLYPSGHPPFAGIVAAPHRYCLGS
jgi:hypothetical protein